MSMRFPTRALWLGCLLLSACADQQESLIVTGAPAWSDVNCIVDPNASAFLFGGVLDVEQQTGYAMPAALLNNLSEQNETNNAGIVTNEIQVTSASVELSSDQAPDLIATVEDMLGSESVDFEVTLASISLPPGGIQGFLVEVIPQATAIAMGDIMAVEFPDQSITVIARVVFHGLRAGTKVGNIGVIDAREFTFPIQLCRGCLLDCSTCPSAEPGMCPADYEPPGFLGGICGNAQDLTIVPPGCEPPQ